MDFEDAKELLDGLVPAQIIAREHLRDVTYRPDESWEFLPYGVFIRYPARSGWAPRLIPWTDIVEVTFKQPDR